MYPWPLMFVSNLTACPALAYILVSLLNMYGWPGPIWLGTGGQADGPRAGLLRVDRPDHTDAVIAVHRDRHLRAGCVDNQHRLRRCWFVGISGLRSEQGGEDYDAEQERGGS
jgi:hypothetical protein